jgi:hypothetical protein
MFSKTAKIYFWFSLSLLVAISYSFLALKQAFSSNYVVQDDARQHIFWMLRFVDPSLFPNDLIADYFQSVAPVGYSHLYRFASWLGIHPFVLNKCLPLILDLMTTSYCFFFCLNLLPIPFAGFLSCLFLNQYLWLRDDLVSATPTAFVYPLLMAFLYYLLRRSPFGVWINIALLGLFYPQGLLVATGVLVLKVVWRRGENPKKHWFEIIGLIIAFVVMLLYALKSSQYEPVITATQAKTMPEFLPGGTSEFFVPSFWQFWFNGKRSGMMPQFAGVVITLAIIISPWLLAKPHWFPLRKAVQPESQILVQLTVASVGLFFLSHLFLFRLHLPSRYTEHSLRIVSAIALAFALTMILDAIITWNQRHQLQFPHSLSLVVTTLFFLCLLVYPAFFQDFPETNYITGQHPQLYQFLRQTPKDSLIASTTEETNQLPTFAQRSILVGSQGYPVPYHLGYYQQIRDRTKDLINAQYSSQAEIVQTVIQKYNLDFWLLKKNAFRPESIKNSNWLMQYQPAAKNAIQQLEAGKTPFLLQRKSDCLVWENHALLLLDAHCIRRLFDKEEVKNEGTRKTFLFHLGAEID